MINRIFVSVLFITLSFFKLNADQSRHYQSVKAEVEKRWEAFSRDVEFIPFRVGRTEKDLQKEFQLLRCVRKYMWSTPEYEVARELIDEDHIRAVDCAAFRFNLTLGGYNASTVILRDKFYIASEGPRSKDVERFFHLLTTCQVSHLVRLTDSHEGDMKKCHPYWEGLVNKSCGDGTFLEIPTEKGAYPVQAYDMAYWIDNKGVDPEKLLELVLEVRDELKSDNELLLVHCSAGVGRTGTFLAGLAIVDAIDNNEEFSIQEIVYRISLQRSHAIAKAEQYMTLHRLAEIYLDS